MSIVNPYEEDLKNVEFYEHHPNEKFIAEREKLAFQEGVEAVRKEAQSKIDALIIGFGEFCKALENSTPVSKEEPKVQTLDRNLPAYVQIGNLYYYVPKTMYDKKVSVEDYVNEITIFDYPDNIPGYFESNIKNNPQNWTPLLKSNILSKHRILP